MRTPFLGGHTVSRSKNLADNQCINLYASIVETKDGKDVGALYSTPGLKGLDTLGSGPIRGQINAAGDLILVSGHEVYGISGKDNTHTLLGTIATYDGPVSLIYNDLDQVALFDGDQGYLFTGPVPTGGTPFVTTCDCANSNANSPPGVLLYVAGSSCDVLGFPLTTNGSTAPTIDIEGSNTQLTGPTGNPESLTWAVAVDASENIYVISSVQTVAFPSTFQTSILIWDAGSTGNVAPSVFRYGSTPNLIEVAAAGASGAVPAIQTMSAPQLGAISADGTPTSPLQLFIG